MQALSLVLAALTIAWIPLDAAWLGGGSAAAAAPMRVALALALWAWTRACMRLPLGAAVNGFVWLQAIGFGALQIRLGGVETDAAHIGYGLFPFVLAAQLALLALPWPRTLLAGLAPAAQLLVVLLVQPHTAASVASHLWLLMLILLLSTWTADAQRRLLVQLLDARHDASHDPLTGLANRRSAEERLDACRAESMRHRDPLSVLALDLDHFKRVNDRHGHAAGDQVLQAVAQVLREEVRGGDLAARHGGEEFLVILPHCACDQAFEIAERIRLRIAGMRVDVDGKVLRATVSIGVASLSGDEPMGTLLVRADAALYAAKTRGRDRCVLAPARSRGPSPFDPASTGNSRHVPAPSTTETS